MNYPSFAYGADNGTTIVTRRLRIPGFRWMPGLIPRAVVNRWLARRPSATAVSWILLASCVATSFAQGIPDTTASPYARIRSVPLQHIQWTDGFWGNWQSVCRTETLPSMWRLMDGAAEKPFLENFRIAAGQASGDHHGAAWNDGDFYKWIEAACGALAQEPDTTLAAHVNHAIAVVGAAQRSDGYLHTPVLIRHRNGDMHARPFQDRHNFEMYNMGHLMTASCLHYRLTGRTEMLDIGRKTADFLCDAFRRPTTDLRANSVCPSHYMGIIDLYRVTQEHRYLELAKTFFRMRNLVEDGGDDNQDRIPFRDQRQAVGHAVRANYLYAGAADLYLETGDPELLTPLTAIWQDVVTRKLHVTGGCGALYDGASPDGAVEQGRITRVHQAYGRPYQLPNTTAHNETCANIGNVMWNWRMFLITGDARYVDIVELALYNSVLSGIGLSGTDFFYVNPLRNTDPLPLALRWSRARVPFVTSFCCPPNVARTLAEVNGYAYSTSAQTVWVNLYGSNVLRTDLADDQHVELVQQSAYPWNGQIRIRVVASGDKPLTLMVRIPGWASGCVCRVNGQVLVKSHPAGTYLPIQRSWQPDDVVELDFPMDVQMLESHPLVEETRNQLAVRRGPLIYCLESSDLPSGVRLADVVLPSDTQLHARFVPDLLQGVTVLEGDLSVRKSPAWKDELYRPYLALDTERLPSRLIPYYAWANRGPSEMSVWLPRR